VRNNAVILESARELLQHYMAAPQGLAHALLERVRNGDEEQHDPGDAELEEKLHVEFADAGVEVNAHEEVVNEVAAAAICALVYERECPHKERNDVAGDNSH
jgi:hypothetical protein